MTTNGGDEPEVGRFSVPEMDCPSCGGKVESGLSRRAGVESVETHPASGRVVVRYDPAVTDREALIAAIEGTGYAVEGDADEGSSEPIRRSPRAIATALGGTILVVGLLLRFALPGVDAALFSILGRTYLLSHGLFVASAAIAGAPILRAGLYSARARSLDIDFLMGLGILGAVAAHHPFEGATLAVLYSVAELLERFSMERARRSLHELMELSPDTATVRRDGEERTIPTEEVAVGDVVVVRPGERLPMDGVVLEGESAVDQSPITGESVPVDKAEGEEVFAGTINESGYLEVQVTSEAGENTLSRIVDLVADAERKRTDREQFVDRFASVYTPAVVLAALLVAVVPPLVLGRAWDVWFLRGLTLLVISCPCAFVISTPVSVVSGITSAARSGVLIKAGTHLEAMGEVETIALDKTGTLTAGELAVTDVIPVGDRSEEELLRCAGAIERRSEHPIAAAIDERADGSGAAARAVAGFENLAGKGVRAELDGVAHYAGKPALFEELGFDLSGTRLRSDGGLCLEEGCREDCESLRDEVVARLEREGKTVVLVGTDERIEGVIGVADEIRPGAREAVSRLREQGIERVVMLTGDNEGTARTIAREVGVDEYRAELLPEEKLDAIEALEREGRVAMVGDGVNDAPALATASVGVAMGAAGTDTAIETADVALMADDLSRLPYLVRLSRTANGVIRSNIGGSLAVKAVLAAGAPFGLVTIVHAVVIGDMGMSLAVTGNAMRLARIEPEE
ncbi:heavy metal translocating P-type ATPase [Halalkalicoccus ordinarius]|uniref:heavy metal translocating P-type ATPase n=1 Tax=Halalkalicoccus ordinarius TaxID=3116651 RepID=UPI00300F4047